VAVRIRLLLVPLTRLTRTDCKSLAPVWEKVALDFANEPGVVVAKVDAEAPASKGTAQRLGVKSYPTIKYFPKGLTEPVDYVGGRAEGDFVAYLNANAGTHRVLGGGLDDAAGTVEILDGIVRKLTGGKAASELVSEASQAVLGLLDDDAQRKYGEYYVRVLEKLEKSDTYAAKELTRLKGMLQRGALSPAKLDEFTAKINILRRFVDNLAGKTEL
jgi:protein disulfide-isomerase A6